MVDKVFKDFCNQGTIDLTSQLPLLKNYLTTDLPLRVPEHERDFCEAACY